MPHPQVVLAIPKRLRAYCACTAAAYSAASRALPRAWRRRIAAPYSGCSCDWNSSTTGDPLEFLARALVHIPDNGQVATRYHGWYANCPRGMLRWAALLRQIFEVDPLVCPHCAGPMRNLAFITHASGIQQILTHRRTRAHGVAC